MILSICQDLESSRRYYFPERIKRGGIADFLVGSVNMKMPQEAGTCIHPPLLFLSVAIK